MEGASDAQHNRVVLGLVLRFLQESGYERSCSTLSVEAGVSLEQVEDDAQPTKLPEILKEYMTLYEEKHGHPPELTPERISYPPLRLRPETIMGTTKLFGSAEAVLQADFFRVLRANHSLDPCSLFYIELPLSCARRFRPSQLTLTAIQEHLLYGLVGCADVGWRLSSVSQGSRTILEEKYGVNKKMLQLFFKNRCQQKQRKKRKKEDRHPHERTHRELLETFGVGSSPGDLLHVNSLLEMVKGDEFEGTSDVSAPTHLINPQTLESYTPSAHLTVSAPAEISP